VLSPRRRALPELALRELPALRAQHPPASLLQLGAALLERRLC